MISPLLTVPSEILTHIAFHLAVLSLPALPDALLPLRYTSKYLCSFLSPSQNSVLYARIYRHKFDDSAVRRRIFSPDSKQCTEQLIYCCKTLSAIQHCNFDQDDPSSALFAAYIMMLDNDGKNRAQLEWAGIDAYVDTFLRTRMYDPGERMANNGWPVDHAANACALWLMWMLTTPEKLEAETLQEREQIALCVLPYASISFRYASAHAPSIHYYLPLPNPTNNDENNTFSIQTAHGPYPIYRSPRRVWSQIYYSSRPAIMPPLATEAAKLVYQSRRDMALFPIPQHLPPTRGDAIAAGLTGVIPTQEDVFEVNAHKAARLIKRIVWDWTRGVATVPGDNDGVEYVEASRMWDCDWWRLRFCWNAWRKQPRWRPGKVYLPGTLSGLWQGKMMIPSEIHLMEFLDDVHYPEPLFTETTLAITTRPIYMRLVEHHCMTGRPWLPVPHSTNLESQENGAQNAWFEGPPGSLRWQTTVDHLTGERNIRIYTNGGQTAEYRTYEPPHRDAAWTGYDHDSNRCPGCNARAECISTAENDDRWKMEEEDDERRREIERTFASVGLGQETTLPADFGYQDNGDDDGEEDEDLDDSDGDANDLDIMEVGEDGTEDIISSDGVVLPRIPKSHDWVRNVIQCDGVKDIIVTGTTDYSHGQAWHHYSYYGRVRPWDGLIGILRAPRNALQGTNILYGYVSGGKNFSGNWRWSPMDPLTPAWECAVVMSKRDD
ncbi:hypothetical protein M378DRAFT_6075 [Amanita muscaria Koide BX008]|uniref:F-box domain-containing protein n=1 Tax=Amanita muscaria (strain Koide BX008) TaxID=946122 RepID=A0A0C2TVB2_AMAMK|nr:hypothetical protein M378DRAFT_6075 [Amanita muscaria Koide BX008]